MQLATVNRERPEQVFITAKNVEGATMTTGLPVAFALGTSNDGASVVIANAAGDFPGFLGVVVKNIPNNDYGQIQVSGWVASVLLSNVGTSITVNVGDPLVPSAAGFASAAPTYANSGFRWIAAASNVPAAISAASYVSGLIRMI